MTYPSDKTSYLRTQPTCARLHSKWKPNRENRGFRLSWPYGAEHRRAIVGRAPTFSAQLKVHDARILHISSQDIERHNSYRKASCDKSNIWQLQELDIPMVPAVLVEVENEDRYQYFQHTASKALAIFGHNPTELGNTLIRIALASNTASAIAVRESILAFSALHRHSIHAQAMESKIAALEALKSTATSEIGPLEAIQHIATGMLLLSFEIHLASCTSEDWTKYLRGVKDVIRSSNLQNLHQYGDLTILFDWVYYHDALAGFSVRHWYKQTNTPATAFLQETCISSNVEIARFDWINQSKLKTSSSLELIVLLSELCETMQTPPCNLSVPEREERKQFLEILEWKIRSTELSESTQKDAKAVLSLELYKIAVLIYLNRMTGGQLKQTVDMQTHINRAFEILAKLDTCERQFPIFVVGCEAQSDVQRAVILDIMSRTQDSATSRSLNHARLLLQALWTQDDLSGGKTHWWSKISYVISCCTIMPSFA